MKISKVVRPGFQREVLADVVIVYIPTRYSCYCYFKECHVRHVRHVNLAEKYANPYTDSVTHLSQIGKSRKTDFYVHISYLGETS